MPKISLSEVFSVKEAHPHSLARTLRKELHPVVEKHLDSFANLDQAIEGGGEFREGTVDDIEQMLIDFAHDLVEAMGMDPKVLDSSSIPLKKKA